jgi:hypothetical protein
MEAGWTNTASIESIPLEAAGAEPFVFFAGRPAAEWTADARRLRSAGLLVFFKLAVWNDDRIVSNRTHAYFKQTAQPACGMF